MATGRVAPVRLASAPTPSGLLLPLSLALGDGGIDGSGDVNWLLSRDLGDLRVVTQGLAREHVLSVPVYVYSILAFEIRQHADKAGNNDEKVAI